MFARLFCLIALHRPDMRFRWVRGTAWSIAPIAAAS